MSDEPTNEDISHMNTKPDPFCPIRFEEWKRDQERVADRLATEAYGIRIYLSELKCKRCKATNKPLAQCSDVFTAYPNEIKLVYFMVCKDCYKGDDIDPRNLLHRTPFEEV